MIDRPLLLAVAWELAVRWAERTSERQEPKRSSDCSASAATFAGWVRETCVTAPQVTSMRWMRSAACCRLEEPLPVSRCWMPSARTSRKVASARSR